LKIQLIWCIIRQNIPFSFHSFDLENAMPMNKHFEWNAEAAEKLYNLPGWSGGYFSVSEEGHVMVRPNRAHPTHSVDLYRISTELHRRGIDFPVLVRFPDLLRDRIRQLRDSFEKAMKSEEYSGKYRHVYPIKVNQQERVVHEVINSQDPSNIGLEAGSKPELIAVIALAPPGCVIVCNGYKDREFIRLALLAQSLGHRTYIVIEKLSELSLAIEEAKNYNMEPLLGVRIRLSAIGKGKWQNSGGERSKFGLTAEQILEMVTTLREQNMLDVLKLIHFHLGSQIPNINDIKSGIREAARYYVEMVKLGTGVDTIDVGGGLGVDYEGSRSRNVCSMNYSMDEYANSIVHIFNEICLENELAPPDIITESGRAVVAHHAILISNVIDTDDREVDTEISIANEDEPSVIYDLKMASAAGWERSPVETYHDVIHLNHEMQTLFATGNISLTDRALGEKLFLQTCQQLRTQLYPNVRAHLDIIDEINDRMASKYFVNISIFQSMPDIWAIDQLFPIMPLHRLNERPDQHAVLYDLTCDSDGHIEDYVCSGITTKSLPLHSLKEKEPYLLGFFLVGAYQETLGDIHNLFGDTHSVNVSLNDDGTYTLDEPIAGDTIRKMLGYVQYDCDALLMQFREKLRSADMTNTEKQSSLNMFCAGLDSYTYLVR
jgi:arginine decarboxylase